MQGQVVVHFGFQKSGSTTLQRKLFMKHPEISYLGIYPDNTLEEVVRRGVVDDEARLHMHDLRNALFETDELNYDFAAAKRAADQVLSGVDWGKTVVFSDEKGSGALASYPCIVTKARRVKELFGNVKSLLIIREQASLIKSNYISLPIDTRTGKFTGRYVDFDTWFEIELRKPYHSLLDSFAYEKIVSVYQKIFGPENTLVLPLEMLRDDRQIFAETLAKYLGIEIHPTLELLSEGERENVAISGRYDSYRRVRQRIPFRGSMRSLVPQQLGDRILNWVLGGSRARVEMSANVQQQVQALYAESNARLAEKLEIPLGQYGYVT